MVYQWKNPKTGKIEESNSYDVPPHKGWVRVYSFGVAAIPGAGSSPSRYVSGSKT